MNGSRSYRLRTDFPGGGAMKDRDWLLPSLALTLVSGLVAIALIPSYSGILPALRILPL